MRNTRDGKLRAASAGGHWEAADYWTTMREGEEEHRIQTTGESMQFDNSNGTSIETIKQLVKDECNEWFKQISKDNLNAVMEVDISDRKLEITPSPNLETIPMVSSNNGLENMKPVEEDIVPTIEQEENLVKHKVHSNKLHEKWSHAFESYAEILENNNVTRTVAFNDNNREMNVDVHILKGELEIPITLLVDTGAQRSFISQTVYDEKLAPYVQRNKSFVRMYGVSGQELTTSGEIELDVAIGNEIVRQKFIIANLKEQGILGFDFCKNHQAEWRWMDKELTLNNPSQSTGNPIQHRVARVTTKTEVTIPARCEVVTAGIIEHAQTACEVGIIEAQTSFVERYSIGVAAVLAQKVENSIPVRLINTSEQEITLSPNTPVAMFSPAMIVEDVQTRSTEVLTTESPILSLRHQFDDQLTVLTEPEKQQFQDLIEQYNTQFIHPGNDLGHTGLVQHKIHTGDNAPIKQRPRREPLGMQGVVKEELIKMENKGIIEPSSSPWGSPVVLVRKKDGTVRFCVDYRKLNNITQKDAYPLPRIEDNLDALRGSTLFSTLDLASGYWQVQMAKEDKEKTAFNTKYGLYQFKVMPFGLCNAPGTFERLMETVLKGMQWERAVLYLDDIIIFSNSVEEHLHRLQEIFERLKEANLTLKPSKCHFFQEEVEFLGHIVNKDGITTDPKKVEAVRNWEVPKRVKEVRAFLGLTGYYRRFIKDYGQIAKPLHELTEKETPFQWTENTHKAFETLKQKLIEAPILGYPSQQEDDTFILDTDASNCHIGGVLSQIQDGKEKVIAYGSKVLSKSEKNYCVTRRELLAVVHFCVHYKHYLIGRKFKLRTDHGALIWLFQFKEPEGQIARWLEILSGFQMDIVHRAGRIHNNGDAMSRRPCDLSCPTCRKGEKLIEDVRTVYVKTAQTGRGRTARRREIAKVRRTEIDAMKWLAEAQEQDIHLQTLNGWTEKPPWNQIKDSPKELRSYWSRWEQLRKEDGIWQFKWRQKGKDTWRWIVPSSQAKRIINDYHNDKMAGHFSVKKTIDAIHRSPYYLPGLQQKVTEVIDRCEVCEKTKPPTRIQKAPMKQCIAERPMQRVAIDILGPLTTTDNGNKYIIVIADYFTKWTEAYAVPDHQASTVAQKIIDNFFTRFGIPEVIHSDQGRDFQSNLFQEMCRLLEIHKTKTTPWHPQSDGMIERFNRTIETLLRQCVQDNQKDWDQHLPFCCAAYRSALHSTTSQTPNMLMLGRELPMPKHLIKPVPEVWKNTQEYCEQLTSRIQNAHEIAAKHTKKSVFQYTNQYNKRSWQRDIKVGDWVWLNNFTKRSGLSPKLQLKWELRPYRITQFLSEVVVEMQQHTTKKKRVVHINKIKKVGDQHKWNEEGLQTTIKNTRKQNTQFEISSQGFPQLRRQRRH